jgi:hypothetical protein
MSLATVISLVMATARVPKGLQSTRLCENSSTAPATTF